MYLCMERNCYVLCNLSCGQANTFFLCSNKDFLSYGYPSSGQILNTNTIDSFKNFDKKKLLESLCSEVRFSDIFSEAKKSSSVENLVLSVIMHLAACNSALTIKARVSTTR